MRPNDTPLKPKLISVGDLCSTLGIKRTKAYELISNRSVESIKIGRRRLILRSSVTKLVKRASLQGDV